MNAGGDAAEQMVRFYLEGFEVVAKISGKGAEHAIAILLNLMKNKKQTKGKARLNTMIKSGKPLTIFTINRKDLPKFAKEAKRYGVLYSALMKKLDKNEDGFVDIMVKQDDASKINRIVKRFNLTVDNDTQIKTDVKKSLDEKKNGKFEVITKDGEVIEKNSKDITDKYQIIDNPSLDTEIKENIQADNSKDAKKDVKEDIKNPKDKADINTNENPTIFDEKRKSVKDDILEIQIQGDDYGKVLGQKEQQRELKRISEAKDKLQILKSQDIDPKNFNQAKTEKDPLSEPNSKKSRVQNEARRQSIRAQLAEIQRDIDAEANVENVKPQIKGKHFVEKGKRFTEKGKHFAEKGRHFADKEKLFAEKGKHFVDKTPSKKAKSNKATSRAR